MALLASTACLAVPAFAMADDSGSTSTAKSDAAAQCRSERSAMGSEAFGKAYGTNHNRRNAFGKCVSHRSSANEAVEATSHSNAAKACKAERDDATFADSHDGKTFAQVYGTNENGHNAFGKCVSGKAKAQSTAAEKSQVSAEKNAAKACKAERKGDPAQFKDTYGAKRNAFGKCVSKKAKATEKSDSDPIS
ncbi:MAG: hypothetical protein ACR2K9_07715 [Solirubrobacteraceae bacterium]